MENEEFYADQFIVYLSIDGTNIEEIEVEVTDPQRSLRSQVESIVSSFNLPKMDPGNNPIQYLLGLMTDDEDTILDFTDEDGRELNLLDYDVQPGDHLHLIQVPIAG